MPQAVPRIRSIPKKHASFRWETELCASFRSSVAPEIWSRHRSGNWLIIEESTCSDGRADQVWARLEPGWNCRTLIANASMLLNPTISRVLAALRRRKLLALEELKIAVGVSLPVLRKVLRDLVVAKLIFPVAEDLYRLSKNISFPKIEICSFEMKLDNWKRALYQSTRYHSFSHRVFVVMPREAMSSVERNKEQFVRMGIGLMTHSADGSTKILVRPSKRDPRSSYQSLMALGMLLSRGAPLRPSD